MRRRRIRRRRIRRRGRRALWAGEAAAGAVAILVTHEGVAGRGGIIIAACVVAAFFVARSV